MDDSAMRRFLYLFVLLPIAIVVVALSVANREWVIFSLDPIGPAAPGWSLGAPLFVFLFAAVALGIVIGGVAAWIRQGRWRHAARMERTTADRLRADIQRLTERLEAITPAIGAPRDRDAA
ncbi:MAG TPA: LapA family protein [Bauldia sp.]|nr:LapA family protein [Bauldia sp.]